MQDEYRIRGPEARPMVNDMGVIDNDVTRPLKPVP